MKLRDVPERDLEFAYLYDFGDGWQHAISVEQAEPLKHSSGYA